MAIHDRYPRRTAYELLFPDAGRASALAEAVRSEASERGIDPRHPHLFLRLEPASRFIREHQEPDEAPGAVQAFGALVYHGVHFEEAGCPLYLLSEDAARTVVAEVPPGPAVPPARSGYLQLPQHLFWLEGEGERVPEPIDGLFWTEGAEGMLHVLLAAGLRPGRPGLGAVPVPEAPLAHAEQWKHADVRGDGTDFRSTIPGAELEGLYGIRTAGEVLVLLARAFALVGAGGGEPGGEPGPDPEGGRPEPPPSRLPWSRIDIERGEDP